MEQRKTKNAVLDFGRMDTRQNNHVDSLQARWGARHTFTLLVFIGFTLCHATRVDMSVAVVSMVGSAPGKVNEEIFN